MSETKGAGVADDRAAARREERARAKEKTKNVKLDDFIVAVHRLASLVGDADVFARHGVTIAEWSMLKAMDGKTQASLGEITKAAGVSRQRQRTLLADLEKKGFITSATPDSGDQRTRAITVSPKSAEVVAAISREFDKLGEKIPSLARGAGKLLGGAMRLAGKLTLTIQRSGRDAPGGERKGGAAPAATPQRDAERKLRREQRGGAGGEGNPQRRAKDQA